jgi:hypothetical protein
MIFSVIAIFIFEVRSSFLIIALKFLDPLIHFLGNNRTLNKVWQRYYWLQARDDVERWCQQCDICAASRGPRTRNRGHMHQYNVGVPFERIAIDVAGPFPRSNQGNRYLLIAKDYFTKCPEAYAIPDQEASTVANALVTNFLCRFGIL